MVLNISLAPLELIGSPFFLCSTTNSLSPYLSFLIIHATYHYAHHVPWMQQHQPKLDPTLVFLVQDRSIDSNHIVALVKETRNASLLTSSTRCLCMILHQLFTVFDHHTWQLTRWWPKQFQILVGAMIFKRFNHPLLWCTWILGIQIKMAWFLIILSILSWS